VPLDEVEGTALLPVEPVPVVMLESLEERPELEPVPVDDDLPLLLAVPLVMVSSPLVALPLPAMPVLAEVE
jgi:hypothetical protein